MAILTTEAVVLRGWKLGETSKILSLFTQDFGKIRVVAKGGRGPKSKFKGCLEPLTHIRAIYYEKKTRDLQLLSKTDLIDPHLKIIGNAKKTSLGLSAVELVEKALESDEPHPDIFKLLTDTLKTINQTDTFVEGVLWYFESNFIDLMGYKPTWDVCLTCEKSLGGAGGFFQPASGGLTCYPCTQEKGGLKISAETLEILYWLQSCDISQAGNLQPAVMQKAEIRKMFDLYFKTHIEHMRSLKSLQLFYELE